MNIHLFGASTPSGAALCQLSQFDLFCYSRHSLDLNRLTLPVDLTNPDSFHPFGDYRDSGVWISFAPIWLFAPFLNYLSIHYPRRLEGLRGVIACSSSSIITKCFAFNAFDRHLIHKLKSAEDQLLDTCRNLSIPCRILRPTLIYGHIGPYADRNLSRVINQLRRFPVIPLPLDTGLRQPIHAIQLAAVVLHFVEQLAYSRWDSQLPECIALGGDTILTYRQMIISLQNVCPPDDPASRCKFVTIPNRLFFFAASILLLISPKRFEAILRTGSNLSGFTPSFQILGSEPKPFPVLPLL